MSVIYRFEWDDQKARNNVSKHGVRFTHAATVLRDPHSMTLYDEEHSGVEERWITLGIAEHGPLLVVVHTFERLEDEVTVIRVISARRATKKEKRAYERQ